MVTQMVFGLLVALTSFLAVGVQTSTVIDGIEFGDLQHVVKADFLVYHMELDNSDPSRLIYSDGCGLKSLEGGISVNLVGQSLICNYYREGYGTTALFKFIVGFHQLNATHHILADHDNYCLRTVDRSNFRTSPFVGRCTIAGAADGAYATFRSPSSVIRDVTRLYRLLVTDSKNNAIRTVDVNRRDVSTLLRSSAVIGPRSMTFDFQNQLVITSEHAVGVFDMSSKTYKLIAGSSLEGYQDGPSQTSRFRYPREIVPINENVLVVADDVNSALRVVSRKNNTVKSVCSAKNGNPKCVVKTHRGLLYVNGELYVGQTGSIGKLTVRTLPPFLNKLCTSSIVTKLPPRQSQVDVEVSQNLHVSFPAGNFVVGLPNNCTVLVQVNGAGSTTSGGVSSGSKNYMCPKTMRAVASAASRSAKFMVNVGGTWHDFNLMVGKHSVHVNSNGQDCRFAVEVIDSHVVKQVYVKANYKVPCKSIQDADASKVIMAVAEEHYRTIKDVCPVCDKSKNEKVSVKCMNDLMTITWPTSYSLPWSANYIPSSVSLLVKAKLRALKKNVLDTLIVKQTPPVVFPVLNKEGFPMTLEIMNTCTSGWKYNRSLKACIQ